MSDMFIPNDQNYVLCVPNPDRPATKDSFISWRSDGTTGHVQFSILGWEISKWELGSQAFNASMPLVFHGNSKLTLPPVISYGWLVQIRPDLDFSRAEFHIQPSW